MEATMKFSINEVRKRLPALVRQVQQDAGASVQITVHHEVVAELCAVWPELAPGTAARDLQQLMKRLPKHRSPKTHVSSHIKTPMYGNGNAAS
jgi:antitoxin (DNA-binding transcriptional repressor) of toxin-antitoxin stability system